jgi:hypothetical protein
LPEDALPASRAGPVRGVRARDGGGYALQKEW